MTRNRDPNCASVISLTRPEPVDVRSTFRSCTHTRCPSRSAARRTRRRRHPLTQREIVGSQGVYWAGLQTLRDVRHHKWMNPIRCRPSSAEVSSASSYGYAAGFSLPFGSNWNGRISSVWCRPIGAVGRRRQGCLGGAPVPRPSDGTAVRFGALAGKPGRRSPSTPRLRVRRRSRRW